MTDQTPDVVTGPDGRPLRIRDVRGRVARNAASDSAAYATTDLVGLRMSGPLIEAVDEWRLEQPNPVSRSEAIRSFVKFALSAAPVMKAWSHDPRLEEPRRKILQDLMPFGSAPRAR